MTSETKIYVELSDEFENLLTGKGLSISEILRSEGIDANITHGIIPGIDEGARTKDVTLIILASSVAVVAIGTAISKVLHEIYHKPVQVDFIEPVELRDEKGNVLVDKNNKPQFKHIPRFVLLQPRKEDSSITGEGQFDPKNGIVAKFSSTVKQLESPDSK